VVASASCRHAVTGKYVAVLDFAPELENCFARNMIRFTKVYAGIGVVNTQNVSGASKRGHQTLDETSVPGISSKQFTAVHGEKLSRRGDPWHRK
jgi:hypothetical protein